MKKLAFLLSALIAAPCLAVEYAIPDATTGVSDPCALNYICLPDDTRQTFNIGSMSYPPNWLQTSTPAARAALGILNVATTSPPDPTQYNVTGQDVEMISGIPTQVWQTTPVTARQSSATALTAALAAGVTISCAPGATVCVPANAGTYTAPSATGSSANAAAQANITSIETSIAAGRGLPGGGSSFNYYDAAGVPHAFTVTQWAAFATALMNFSYALQGGYLDALAAGTVFVAPSNQIQLN